MSQALYPGSTIGLIGLNRNCGTLIRAVREMGMKVAVYLRNPNQQVSKLVDDTFVGSFNDKDKLHEFGDACDAIVYQTPTIDSAVIEYLNHFAAVPQGKDAIEIVQDRLMERAFLTQINANIAPYVTVVSLDDVYSEIDSIGYPALLKPIQKGLGEESMMIRKQSDIARAADFIDTGTYLLESWIDHTREFSLAAAVDATAMEMFPLAEQRYDDDRRLVEVQTPAKVDDDLQNEMERIVKTVAGSLHYHGVVSVHFYLTNTGALYVKGIEPGVLAAGDIYRYVTSVSEADQLIRTAVGMPIHKVSALQNGLMMVLRNKQFDAIKRQWLLKDNWQYELFQDDFKNPEAIRGLVYVTGGDLVDLNHQVSDTEVWSDQLGDVTDDAGDTDAEHPLE